MIRIIEKNEAFVLVTCPECLSKFTIEPEDIVYLPPSYKYKGVECPVCNNSIFDGFLDIKKITKKELDEMTKDV